MSEKQQQNPAVPENNEPSTIEWITGELAALNDQIKQNVNLDLDTEDISHRIAALKNQLTARTGILAETAAQSQELMKQVQAMSEKLKAKIGQEALDTMNNITTVSQDVRKQVTDVLSNPYDHVPSGAKPYVDSFMDGLSSMKDGAVAVGGKMLDTVQYVWKKFEAKFADALDFLGIPPASVITKFAIAHVYGIFSPEKAAAVRAEAQEESDFHFLRKRLAKLVKTQNENRAKKNPPESPITLTIHPVDGYITYKVMTKKQREELERNILLAIKRGDTEINFDDFLNIEESTKSSGSKEETKQDAPNTEANDESTPLALTDLPTESIDFAHLQDGIDIKGKKLRIESSPAAIVYGDNRWKMQHTDLTKRAFANFSINKADWKGNALEITVTGAPNRFAAMAGSFMGNNAAQPETVTKTMDKNQVLELVQHLSSESSGPYQFKGAPAQLVI